MVAGVVIRGSATGIGSSSNLVAAGVARQHESQLGFRTWLSYGLPTVELPLRVAWLRCSHIGC
jgi:Na+/H+ antiporter NhaD/arsenite permease-like protein